MRKVRLVLEYDGTGFEGWQSQGAAIRARPSIQDVLEAAFTSITGENAHVQAAGRTDAGVHALGQVATFVTESAIPLDSLRKALNSRLPSDMAVREIDEVPLDFNPRHHTLGKLYRYQIHQGATRRPLMRVDHWWVRRPLDLAAMRQAAAALVGEHDFSSFRASGCASKHAVRRVYRLEILTPTPESVHIEIHATAFLKQMVRNIVGTLVEVGVGRREASSMEAVLGARDRGRAGQTAPALGLTLVKVYYPEDPPPSFS